MTATDMNGGATWGVGSVIGTAASIMGGHFVPFVGTALVGSVPSLLFKLVLPDSHIQGIVDLIIGQVVTVMLIYGTVQALRGRQVSVGECLSDGLKRLGPAIGVALIAGIGIAIGMVLLVVPGLILATIWAVAIPSAVVERTGVFASLSRSVDLTRERRWRSFGAILVAGLITIVIAAVIGGLAVVIGGVQSVSFAVVLWAITAISQAFSACVVATLYYNLRREKEGVGIEQIAQVFD
jgi:hypothetical protein